MLGAAEPTAAGGRRLVYLAAARGPRVRENPITGRIRDRNGHCWSSEAGRARRTDGGRCEGCSGRGPERHPCLFAAVVAAGLRAVEAPSDGFLDAAKAD